MIKRIVKVIIWVIVVSFVVYLCVSGLSAMGVVGKIFGGNFENGNVLLNNYQEITRLDINVKATNLKIRTMTENGLKVETNNEYVVNWVDGQTLNVMEKSHGLFGFGGTGDVTIYINEKMSFENVEISVGAGVLEIANLTAENLSLKLGAGKTTIEKINVKSLAKIDGGAGMLEIKEGGMRNLQLDMGAGKADLTMDLAGDNKIHTGVGKLTLNLVGQEKLYRFVVNKGIGSVTLNGEAFADGETKGSGSVQIKIDSGVGEVEVKTK